MAEITRRQMIQGAAAAGAVAMTWGPAAAAAPDVNAIMRWMIEPYVWRLQYVVRYCVNPMYEPRYTEGERVEIKFKGGDRDTRSFKAESLERAEGVVRFMIPARAVPWRYVRARWRDAPLKFRIKLERAADWQRPAPGPLYVVGTKRGYALVSAQRMRRVRAPKLSQIETAS